MFAWRSVEEVELVVLAEDLSRPRVRDSRRAWLSVKPRVRGAFVIGTRVSESEVRRRKAAGPRSKATRNESIRPLEG